MPHAIWKGQISFGLVNVPVALYPAEAPAELQFHLLDSQNLARLKYKRVNEVTGEEVPMERIVKGYELDSGEHVVLSDQDFENVDVEATQTIDIQDFVDLAAIDYIYFDKPYYLVPGKKAEKGYVLLRETLRRTGKVGIAKVVIRTRQYLAALIPQGNGLVLNLLRYAHELRDFNEFDLPSKDFSEYKISDRELEMAVNLVNTMTAKWEPEKYHDEYRDKLLAWIERKAREGEQVQPPERAPVKPVAEVVDFMELLKKSVQEKEKARKSQEVPAKGGKARASRKKAGGAGK
ncbi:MAG: Ku protein [Deltaproteobacteria bacterium]|nr:Ku protein [Deltaproteobacteria bacterium]MDI6853217.1 Ku protein [Deltaproteobacteria bacterium]